MVQSKIDQAVPFSARQENVHLSQVVPHADSSLLFVYPNERSARDEAAKRVKVFLGATRKPECDG